MDLMLTSFGISHLRRPENRENNIFYRMPPAALSSSGSEFMPEYAVLLIADRIILDAKAFELLTTGRHTAYGNVALMIKMLYDEGFIRLEDFDSTIAHNHNLLEDMLARDLKEIGSWTNPLIQALEEWRIYYERFQGVLRRDYMREQLGADEPTSEDQEFFDSLSDILNFHAHKAAQYLLSTGGPYAPYMRHFRASHSLRAQPLWEEILRLPYKRQKRETREILRTILTEYLSYVNANLLLAARFDAGFHDWNDFRPFYRDKFLRIGRTAAPGHSEADKISQLFSISFPEFAFWKPESIIRALKDKRIADLRQLVRDAVAGEVEFDRDFAARVLSEVLKIERSLGKIRNIVSYVTMPLGFLPMVGTPIQKATEEAVVQPIAHRKRKQHRWFYFISELAERSQC